ncbi:hypothetical protein LguiA_030383 [Lonicera macranthoides]
MRLFILFLVFSVFHVSYVTCFHLSRGFEIHIINGFPNNSYPLKLRCQSKDNDLGDHDLQRSEEFYWKFHNHLFGRTLYFCHFYWGDIDKSVDVFNDEKRFPSCDDDKSTKVGKCYWLVKDDGFYSCQGFCEANVSRSWKKIYSWKPDKPIKGLS